jgi:hypothetical protein
MPAVKARFFVMGDAGGIMSAVPVGGEPWVAGAGWRRLGGGSVQPAGILAPEWCDSASHRLSPHPPLKHPDQRGVGTPRCACGSVDTLADAT